MKKQQELLEPLQDEIYQAVKSIAQRKGYAAVIDRASASSIIFAQPSIDISEEVLQELGITIN
jgi:outer membrane protein